MGLLLFLIGLVAYIWLLVTIVKKFNGWRWRIGVVVVLFLIHAWDIILGRAYLNYRCAQDGGNHVYQTVTINSDEIQWLYRKDAYSNNRISATGIYNFNGTYKFDDKSYKYDPKNYKYNYENMRYPVLPERYKRGWPNANSRQTFWGQLLKVPKTGTGYYDAATDLLLGERVVYRYWIMHSRFLGLFRLDGDYEECPEYSRSALGELKNSIFKITDNSEL